MRRAVLGLVALVATTSCLRAPRLDPNHCANNDGDAFCAARDEARPYCVVGSDPCGSMHGTEAGDDGCVATRPALECHAACGIDGIGGIGGIDGEADACEGGVGSSSSGLAGSESTQSMEVDASSSGSEGTCATAQECTDPLLPFCLEGICESCGEGAQPNVLCASADDTKPYCVEDECVACSTADDDSCGGATPICDRSQGICVQCSDHEQCEAVGSPACDIATGECFDADATTAVDLPTEGTLEAAIAAVEPGESHTILVSGHIFTSHTVTIDAGKRIALVSAKNVEQPIRGTSSEPTLNVRGQGTALFLYRVSVRSEGSSGVRTAAAAHVYIDRSEVVADVMPALSLGVGTQAFVRDSIVVGLEDHAIESGASRLDLQFVTTVSAVLGWHGLACSGGNVTARNSLLLSRFSAPLDCEAAQLVDTITRSGASFDEDWFVQYPLDLRLVVSEDTAPFATGATWRAGDSRFDIDGNRRPTENGTPTFVGAHAPAQPL